MNALGTTLRMVRFEHSVFALPFALAGAWLAAGGLPPWPDLVGIVVAAVAARNAAMAFNRIADRDIDATNPRTAGRELVTGALSVRYAVVFTLVNLAIFIGVSYWLAPVCGWLSLPVAGVLLGYSKLKRISWLCHLGLGVALACAPLGAWLAVNKGFDGDWLAPVLLGLGVEHDRAEGLSSLPARFGAGPAQVVSILAFVAALGVWAAAGWRSGLGAWYWAGLDAVAVLMIVEQVLVRRDPKAIPLAFFRVNAWVGVVFFGGLLAALTAMGGRG
jgi:4-hydroxybenzoate polyprenyltransferase